MKPADKQRAEKAFERWLAKQDRYMYPIQWEWRWREAYLAGLREGRKDAIRRQKKDLLKRLKKK